MKIIPSHFHGVEFSISSLLIAADNRSNCLTDNPLRFFSFLFAIFPIAMALLFILHE